MDWEINRAKNCTLSQNKVYIFVSTQGMPDESSLYKYNGRNTLCSMFQHAFLKRSGLPSEYPQSRRRTSASRPDKLPLKGEYMVAVWYN